MMIRPSSAERSRMRRRRVFMGPTARSPEPPPAGGGREVSNLSSAAGVQYGLRYVHRQIYQDEDQTNEQRETHDRVVIRLQDRPDGVAAEARPIEDRFDHYGVSNKRAEDQADLSQRADKGAAQNVFPDHAASGNAHCRLIEHEVA